LIFHSKENFE